jgi:phenylacetate-CoA ligase
MNLRSLAKSFPYPIQQIIRHIYGAVPTSIRLGKTFWEMYNFLQESQWWSKEKLEDYQMQQLKKLLEHSYENVLYYRRLFDEYGLKISHIQSKDDLKQIPYLTKDIFRANVEDMSAHNFDLKYMQHAHTSGTTGKPLQFYSDGHCNQKELASIYHQWARVGYIPGEPLVQLRGAIITNGNPVQYDPISKVLRLSPKISDKETVVYYIENMKRFGSRFLHGYPSAIASFAHAIKNFGLAVPFTLQSVLFASETVYSWEREITEEVFNSRIFSHYGNAERVVLAAECENSDLYHCIPQYGITEINSETNEIVATGFLNYVNPFIRYCTTDVAFLEEHNSCSHCGRQYFPVLKRIEGRLEDFIVSPDNTLIAPAVITHPFKDLKTIKETQIIQDSFNHLILRLVVFKNVDRKKVDDEVFLLCDSLKQIIGNIDIETEFVTEIERNKSGKFRWIISDVSKGLLEKGLYGKRGIL